MCIKVNLQYDHLLRKCLPLCETRFTLQSASLIEWMGGARELIDRWRHSVDPTNQDQPSLRQSWDDIMLQFMVRNIDDDKEAKTYVDYDDLTRRPMTASLC